MISGRIVPQDRSLPLRASLHRVRVIRRRMQPVEQFVPRASETPRSIGIMALRGEGAAETDCYRHGGAREADSSIVAVKKLLAPDARHSPMTQVAPISSEGRFRAVLRTARRGVATIARLTAFAAALLWRASPGLTVALLLLSAVGGLVPLLQVWATARLIDALMGAGAPLPGPSGGGGAALAGALVPILPWLGALVGSAVLAQLTGPLASLLAAYLNEPVAETVQRRVYERAMSLRLAAFESPEYYDQLDRARQFLGGEVAVTLQTAQALLASVIGSLSTMGVLAAVKWPFALLLLAGSVPLVIVDARQNEAFVRIQYRETPLKRRVAYWQELSTKRGPAAELRLFGLGRHFLEQWRRLRERLVQERFDSQRRFVRASLLASTASHGLSGVVIVGLVAAAWQGQISPGVLVAALYALHRFEECRTSTRHRAEDLVFLFGAGLSYLREFLSPGGEERASGAEAPRPIRLGIVFENTSFTYPGASEPALRDVSLEIRPGERLALVGENGAGKSTLARLLLALDEPSEGRILVDGIDLREIDPASWRARAAAVFQSFVRYALTARENIGLGDPRCLRHAEAIAAAARRSGAHEIIQELPSGYDTLLGKGFEGAHDLSVGQWQKLALARAYLRQAQLLVLDEPAASLDALAEREVYRQFSQASEGKTVLLISHRLGSARLADRIVVLEKGRVVQVGSHEALITRGGPYAEMYALQAEWYREPAAGGSTTETGAAGDA
jgi:ATP-binding cassette, subfamily B, bacterial